MQTADRGDDPDADLELIQPEDFLPRSPFPDDARRLGFDRYSGGDAAWIALAANLDGTKASHRVIATLLLGFFLFPVLMTLAFLVR
jgi:hypothetical protein